MAVPFTLLVLVRRHIEEDGHAEGGTALLGLVRVLAVDSAWRLFRGDNAPEVAVTVGNADGGYAFLHPPLAGNVGGMSSADGAE